MIRRPSAKFEWWHSIVTFVALLIAVQLLGFSVAAFSAVEVTPSFAEEVGRTIVSLLCLAAVVYLVLQLKTQIALLIRRPCGELKSRV